MQDKIMKFLAYQGKISVVCASTTKLVEDARKIHDLSPVATAAFGRLLTISAIMGNEMKSAKDKLTVQIKGNGPLGTMLVTADNFPRVKGYVANPVVDFAEYFAKSEQKNTAVALGVLVDKNGVKSAGGYIITPMPDATEEEISQIEQSIFKAGAISKMLDQELSLIEIAKKVTGDENIKIIEDNITPVYECNCSKEHLSNSLATLDKTALKEMIEEDGKAEIICHFCNKKYEFSKEELEEILEKR